MHSYKAIDFGLLLCWESSYVMNKINSSKSENTTYFASFSRTFSAEIARI